MALSSITAVLHVATAVSAGATCLDFVHSSRVGGRICEAVV